MSVPSLTVQLSKFKKNGVAPPFLLTVFWLEFSVHYPQRQNHKTLLLGLGLQAHLRPFLASGIQMEIKCKVAQGFKSTGSSSEKIWVQFPTAHAADYDCL